MNSRRFALAAAAALIVAFVSVNLIADVWFRSARLDLTESRLYSLSDGTQSVLDQLSEPVQLTFYYSRDAAGRYPAVQAYAGRVREVLQTIAARSRGRVRFIEVDPKPFTDEEDRAVQAGVEATPLQEGADPLYFGLSGANAIDDTRAIPFFNPQREPFLEYELTRLIYELENPDPIRAALITALPLDAGAEPGPFGPPRRPNAFAQELGRLMQVEALPQDFTEIPADADVLAIIHPAPLSPQQLFAIDQFIMRKGRAFIAIDPVSIAAAEQAGGDPFASPQGPAPTASRLEPLLSQWGVAGSPDVVMDLEGALPVSATDAQGQERPAPQPLFFNIPADRLNRDDLTTAWLQRGMNVAAPGALSYSERDGVTFTPLATTSGDTMRLPAARVLMRPSPLELLREWVSARRAETIALRVSGVLPSAYASGPPEGAAALDGQAVLARSAAPVELIVVGDADFLIDDLYVTPGQATTFADNGAFAVNAIEMLGGAPELIRLRSRALSNRPMTVIDQMERDAARRIEQRQTQLQQELEAAEQRLQEVQAQGRGSGFFAGDLGAELTQDERAELERFRARAVEVRGQLRAVQRDLRSGIDQLQALIVFVNVWLGPLLVACAGLFLFWRRQRPAIGKEAVR
jgi:ABC-type uncharacterized transport system involved in gliding motility auxiliary subunit